MMRRFKKTLATVMCIIMILTVAPLSGFVGFDVNLDWLDFSTKASAATYSGKCGANLTWSLDTSTGKLVITGTGAMYNYSYNSYGTYSTTAPWGSYYSSIKTVTIGDSVTSIGNYAFTTCTSLTSVTIPDSVTSIGNYAFAYCDSLTSVTIGDSVTSIGDDAFYKCKSLTSITVDKDNTAYSSDEYGVLFNKDKTQLIQYPIGNERTSYTIPDSVTGIGGYAFYYCTSLTSVTIPDSVTSIGSSTFYYCTSLTSVTIGDSVTSIGNYAFTACTSLTSVTIPDSVTSIGYYAFRGCTSLTSVIIGDSVTSIDDYAFEGCTSLKNITIPDSVTSIGNNAFYGTGYYENSANWEDGVLYINNHLIGAEDDLSGTYAVKDGTKCVAGSAFSGCSGLVSVSVPNTLVNIGSGAFSNCSGLLSVTLGSNVEAIGSSAFEKCSKLVKVDLPESVLNIADHAFANCSSLVSVEGGENVNEIGNFAFSGCAKLAKFTAVDNVVTVGSQAFKGCSSLSAFTGASEIEIIRAHAFASCSGLKKLALGKGLKTVGSDAFSGCTSLEEVKYEGSVEDWCTIDFASKKSNPCYRTTNVTFNGESIPEAIVIPDGTKSIGSWVLYNFTKLKTIKIPVSVESVGNGAFYNCSNLETTYYTGTREQWENISIGEENTYLTKNVVYSCDSDTSYSVYGTCGDNLNWILTTNGELIIDGYGTIPNYASSSTPWYSYLSKIKTVRIDADVTEIGGNAFNGCTALESVYYDGDLSAWCGIAFSTPTSNPLYYASKFYIKDQLVEGELVIPDGVTSIGQFAFRTNKAITRIIIPDSVLTIGMSAFYNCSNIEFVDFGDGIVGIENYAFRGCSDLRKILLPKDIAVVSENAFQYCSKISDVYFEGTEEEWNDIYVDPSNTAILNATKHFNHTHSYEKTVDIPSTCLDQGRFKIICECGRISGYETAPLSDCNPGQWIIDVEVTCTTDGFKHNECTVCGETLKSETVKSTGHTSGDWETKAESDCTNKGTAVKNCTVCGEELETKTIDALGHTAGDWETTVEPDCVNEGTAVKKCTVCGGELETKAIDALGHTAGDWETMVEPGCTNEGTAVKNCTVCGEKLETKAIDALGHTDGEWEITVAPTTSKEGQKTLYCSVCGAAIKTEKMEMLAPICDSISWEVVDGKAVITGSDEKVSGAVVIPQEISEHPVTAIADGAFAGRTDITSITLPEGVTTIGECAFAFCEGIADINIPESVTDLDETAFIGCINLEKIEIDEENDKYSTDENGVIYNKDKTKIIYAPKKAVGDAYTMPATVEYAETSAFVDCSNFVITLSDNFYDIDLFVLDFLSVSEFRVNSTNPYFTVIDGVLYNKNVTQIIKYPIDSNCELFVMPESVTDTDWYYVFCVELLDFGEIKLKYGCAEVATDTNYVRTPANLTVHIHENFEDIDYIINGPAHICIDFMSDAEFAELKSAIDDFKSECVQEFEEIKQEVSETYGKDSAEYAVIEKLSDDYMDAFAGFVDCGSDHSRLHPTAEIEEKLDATCTEDGYIRYYCEDCGYKFEVVLEATGHNHKTTVTAPTCEDKGYTTYTCECGDSYVDDYVDATGHSYTTVVTAPTCTEQGYTSYTCECGDSYVDNYLDATGHSYTSEVTTPATHTATGVMTYTCHCGDTYTETIDKIAEHNHTAEVTAPTCEDQGYTTYTCVCGDSYVADYVDAKGHTAGEWVVTKPATSTQSGTKTQSCTVCGTVLNTQTIPAYGKVNSVSVSNVSLDYKSSTTLNPQISVDAGVKYTVTYSSSNPSVASVDANGKITTNDTGSATITVTVTDQFGNTVSDTCNVEVKYNWWQWILVIVLFGWIWY